MRWWLVMAAGAAFVLTPAMVNPLAVINGSTIIGLILLGVSTYKLTKEEAK